MILIPIKSKMNLYLLLLFSVYCTNATYIPGSPGGEWTKNELLTVRAKIWRLITDTKAIKTYEQKIIKRKSNADERQNLLFFAAKLIRLSFHDCVPYKDWTGGCDGCLNWSNITDRYELYMPEWKFKYPDIKEGGNTGLEYTVWILEKLYTDKNFPPEAPKLVKSLKSTGKSRADLWAYAAKVAIEYTVETNNYFCDGRPKDRDWDGSYIGFEPSNDCHRDKDKPDCKVLLPREIKFQYGRRDCVPDDSTSGAYKTSKKEAHPNPEGNGDETMEYFQKHFKLNGRETISLMGAHTLGRLRMSTSAYKYQWVSRGGYLFNNQYYHNFVNRPEWFIMPQNDQCTEVGYHGAPTYKNGKKLYTKKLPDTTMVPSYPGFTKSGGPTHWVRMWFACPDCTLGNKYPDAIKNEYQSCCVGRPKDLMCKVDNQSHNPNYIGTLLHNKAHDTKGCEKYRYEFGVDSMLINAEMGLYYKFEQENGVITKGCPNTMSMGKLKQELDKRYKNKRGDLVRQGYKPNCEKNDMRIPSTDKPFHQIIEDYADNQSTWVSDFIPAFEKMVANGYKASDLHDAPSSWKGTVCTRTKVGKVQQIQCK